MTDFIPYSKLRRNSDYAEHKGIHLLSQGDARFLMADAIPVNTDSILQDYRQPLRSCKFLGVELCFVLGRAINEIPTADGLILTDHINLFGDNPLIGHNDDSYGTRFPDMSHVYPNELQDILLKITYDHTTLKLKPGIIIGIPDQQELNKVEINGINRFEYFLFVNAFIPEVIIARHCDISITGIVFNRENSNYSQIEMVLLEFIKFFKHKDLETRQINR